MTRTLNQTYLYILLLLFSMSSCSRNTEPEMYLIPKNFIGRVNIIFNQEDGAPGKYENGRRVYEIPLNGILLTQLKDEYGFVDRTYYYVDNKGKRTPLHIYKEDYDSDGTKKWVVRDSIEVGIFLDGTTGQYNNRDNSKSVKWQEFIVSSYRELAKIEPMESFENRVKKAIGLDF